MSSVSKRLLEGLKGNGADFFVTVPCKLSAELVRLIREDKEIIHVAPGSPPLKPIPLSPVYIRDRFMGAVEGQ